VQAAILAIRLSRTIREQEGIAVELKNKTVLVTGGLKGIGKAITEKLASQGADVVVNGRTIGDCRKWIDLLQLNGIKAKAVPCDVSEQSQVADMVREIVEEFGKIDILVNNAGVYPACPLLELTERQFDQIISINLKGTFFVTQEVAKQTMVPRTSGKIICISSMDGWMPAPGVAAYAASKAGINSLIKSFALELAPFNITANAVAPGWVATETVLNSDRWKHTIKDIPSGRLASPEEIADVVMFLAGEKSRYINGEIINVNGGMLMR
jgi:3-oxoacyl-[acyl-carrier protein] reductase